MRLSLLLILISVSSVLAQQRAVYLKLKDIKTDTAKKQIVFRYRLANMAPKDSLGIFIQRANGQQFKLKAVYGDVGTTLTDGRNKVIFWNPVADRQKFDEDVAVVFTVKTQNGQGITKKQSIDLWRWGINAGLAGYCLWESISIGKAVNDYNGDEPPNNLSEKAATDATMESIRQRQQRLYPVLAVSAAALLANITMSVIQSRYKLKSDKLSLTGTSGSMGIAYTF